MNFWPWRDMKRRLLLSHYEMCMIQFCNNNKKEEKNSTEKWSNHNEYPMGGKTMILFHITSKTRTQVHHRTIYVVSSVLYPSKCSFLLIFFSGLVFVSFCKEQQRWKQKLKQKKQQLTESVIEGLCGGSLLF